MLPEGAHTGDRYIPCFPAAEEEKHQAEEAVAPINSLNKQEFSKGDSLKAGRTWEGNHFP